MSGDVIVLIVLSPFLLCALGLFIYMIVQGIIEERNYR